MIRTHRIYLDTNVYFRPFDDQTIPGIRGESDAFLRILKAILEGRVTAMCSDILHYEVFLTRDAGKKAKVESLLSLCEERIEQSALILHWSEKIENACRLSGRDSIHVISATFGRAVSYYTCDQELIKKSRKIASFLFSNGLGTLSILNPCEFKLVP